MVFGRGESLQASIEKSFAGTPSASLTLGIRAGSLIVKVSSYRSPPRRYGWSASGVITPFGKAKPRRTVPQLGDVEVSVIILEQGVNAPVEIAIGVGVLPADARHFGAAGTTPGLPQAFVRDRSVDGRELVISVLTHGYAFS